MSTNTTKAPSRRGVLKGLGGLAAAGAGSGLAAGEAVAATTRVRHDIKTAAGKVALDLYREAVKRMKALPEGNPLSWNFQANIHAHSHSQSQALALFNQSGVTSDMRILALGPNGNGAGGVWWTCSHDHDNLDGSPADGYATHFTSWHRLYIWHFERICEKALADKLGGKKFGLPYWNYLDLTQLKLPKSILDPQVRIGGRLVDNALHHDDRRPEFVSQGLRAIRTDPDSTDILARDTMRSKQFFDLSTSNGGFRQGFSSAIDGTPHGSVHVRVGTEDGLGMGDFATAGRDPIFWLHHNNIDRLWESWRAPTAAGVSTRDPKAPKASTWLNRTFKFAGVDGKASFKKASDALSLPKLDYKFDRLQSIGTIAFLAPNAETEVIKVKTVAESNGQSITVAPGNLPVIMTLTPKLPEAEVKTLARDGGNRFWLIIEVSTKKNPRSLFEVSVAAKKAAGGSATEQKTVQVFNLFAAGMHQRHGTGYKTAWQVDITELVRGSRLDLAKPLDITIKPKAGDASGLVTISKMRVEAQ